MNKLKEKKSDKPIYKNVFTFPRDLEHLKYFDKNPHPDKFPDKILAYEGFHASQDLNTNIFQKRLDFSMVSKYLQPYLSDLDRKLLLMPEKFHEMIAQTDDEDYKIAFTHLRDVFYSYFSTPISDSIRPDIQWIDYKFATNYRIAQKPLQDLKNNLFNPKAMDKLAEKLEESGAFGDERRDFYFWNTEPRNWSDISYQSRPVNHYYPGYSQYSFDKITNIPLRISKLNLTPQYWALGDFTINAIPEGYVQPKGNGKYDICVNKVFLFVDDKFNFEGSGLLGTWNLHNRYPSSMLEKYATSWLYEYFPITYLSNSDFREFQRHGYGATIPVLSKPHEVENFEPVCKEYPFVK